MNNDITTWWEEGVFRSTVFYPGQYLVNGEMKFLKEGTTLRWNDATAKWEEENKW